MHCNQDFIGKIISALLISSQLPHNVREERRCFQIWKPEPSTVRREFPSNVSKIYTLPQSTVSFLNNYPAPMTYQGS